MLVTTAEDSYNIFRPNLEPDEEGLATINEETNEEENKETTNET